MDVNKIFNRIWKKFKISTKLEKHFARVPTNRILRQKKKLSTKKKYSFDKRIDTIFQIVVACCMICLFDRKIPSAEKGRQSKAHLQHAEK
jgi:hypothetical protein